MSESKVDRRSLKTEKALCDALSELLMDKKLHKITVQEIVDKADVSRITFYRHYLDVYDLYDKITDTVLVDFGIAVLRLESCNTFEFFSNVINYIYKNQAVCKLIFNPNSTSDIKYRLSKLVEGVYRQIISEKYNVHLTHKAVSYISSYRVQGCLGIVQNWVQAGFKDSCEFIISLLNDLNDEKNAEYFDKII